MSTHPDHDDYDEPVFPEDGAVDELRADADAHDRFRAERRRGFTEDDDG
ncbi:hypothetical protein GCM10023224_05410 [Streptomonospora halophila]|uniref:Uncharacterized protein n=1 Tax=Streptomonospora halophila TaxID=427369 RepID=A0ABP9G5W4_9ACTN